MVHLTRLMKIRVPEASSETPTPTSPNAYDRISRALGFLDRYDKPGNVDRAIVALNAAVASDPRFALGYATLCDAYRMKYRTENDPAIIPQAESNCMKALQLNDKLPAVHVIGWLSSTPLSGRTTSLSQQYQESDGHESERCRSTLIGLSEVNEKLNHPGKPSKLQTSDRAAARLLERIPEAGALL